ncbi:hypothetical protein K502DRAFT_331000 [Neoconidiobolus thromboides FSU 785]|nr:hypothetical protein K502DRAFT_331000 [Neoconidiobolus thromboides FSU 785]
MDQLPRYNKEFQPDNYETNTKRWNQTMKEKSRNYPINSPFFTTPPKLNNSPLDNSSNNFNELRSRSHLNPQSLKNDKSNERKLPSIRQHSRSSSLTFNHYLSELSPNYQSGFSAINEAKENSLELNYFQDIDSEASDLEMERNGNGLGLFNLNSRSKKLPLSPKQEKELELENYKNLIEQQKKTIATISSELSKAQFHITELNHRINDAENKQKESNDKLKNVTIRCIQAEKREVEIKEKYDAIEQETISLKEELLELKKEKGIKQIIEKDSHVTKKKIELEMSLNQIMDDSKISLQQLINQYNKLNLIKNELHNINSIIPIDEELKQDDNIN